MTDEDAEHDTKPLKHSHQPERRNSRGRTARVGMRLLFIDLMNENYVNGADSSSRTSITVFFLGNS
jgi:hypothetical protein